MSVSHGNRTSVPCAWSVHVSPDFAVAVTTIDFVTAASTPMDLLPGNPYQYCPTRIHLAVLRRSVRRIPSAATDPHRELRRPSTWQQYEFTVVSNWVAKSFGFLRSQTTTTATLTSPFRKFLDPTRPLKRTKRKSRSRWLFVSTNGFRDSKNAKTIPSSSCRQIISNLIARFRIGPYV